jgi:hypothetical protein
MLLDKIYYCSVLPYDNGYILYLQFKMYLFYNKIANMSFFFRSIGMAQRMRVCASSVPITYLSRLEGQR